MKTAPFVAERWFLLKARCQMAIGDYSGAKQTLEAALKKFKYEVGIRLLGIEIYNHNDEFVKAKKLQVEIDQLWSSSSWRYRDPEELIAIGKNKLGGRVDAKTVLTRFFDAAQQRRPQDASSYLAIGDLALQKHDYTLAIENFRQAAKLQPHNPDGFYGLAVAYRESDSQAAEEALRQALSLNPRHAPSLLLRVDQSINAENYSKSETALERVLEINPRHPEAWAYKAVLAHLTNRPKQESEYRAKALSKWSRNPHVDHLIGKKLAQKYRFQEAERYQRRALIYDPSYLPAKIELAHNLLRLGQELEGWKLADEVFDADQYSVVAHNLVTLRDNLSSFTTLEADGFVVRMSKREAAIYGEHALRLLREAKRQLAEKYQTELETPIFIEIFPSQQDFAIRTFGLPGGQGFLGVCFGRVITMNSPAAQGARLTNWKSVLWHEFCHVVTLQKTKNRMPRWLSEGISVYEERQRQPSWGQDFTLGYYEMIQQGDLTPLSELSSAFLRPKSAAHLDFAYYESSLAVEFLIETFGFEALLQVLDELALGIPINDSLRRHTAPLSVLNKQFQAYVDQVIDNHLVIEVDTPPHVSLVPEADERPDQSDIRDAYLAKASELQKSRKFESSNETIAKLLASYLDRQTAALAYALQAGNFRGLKDAHQELNSIKRWIEHDASNVEACIRGVELAGQLSAWKEQRFFCDQLLAVDPLLKQPHRVLAQLSETANDDTTLISSLRSLANMDPVDSADIHYRLAAALHRQGDLIQARRHVLLALDQAPRYRDAHRLLLKLVEDQPVESESDADSTQPASSGGESNEK